jgi:hypothetical protein
MGEDLTNSLPSSDSDKLTLLVAEVGSLKAKTDRINVRLDELDLRVRDAKVQKHQLEASHLISYTAKAVLILFAELKWIAAHGSRRSPQCRRV